mmetsp:Transcript_6825/g.13539  ORF Transcript_6825/g.13539 Transcript_6825/m.13539 type:complete len:216 (-) Transcript_6825:475-1122(-)
MFVANVGSVANMEPPRHAPSLLRRSLLTTISSLLSKISLYAFSTSVFSLPENPGNSVASPARTIFWTSMLSRPLSHIFILRNTRSESPSSLLWFPRIDCGAKRTSGSTHRSESWIDIIFPSLPMGSSYSISSSTFRFDFSELSCCRAFFFMFFFLFFFIASPSFVTTLTRCCFFSAGCSLIFISSSILASNLLASSIVSSSFILAWVSWRTFTKS